MSPSDSIETAIKVTMRSYQTVSIIESSIPEENGARATPSPPLEQVSLESPPTSQSSGGTTLVEKISIHSTSEPLPQVSQDPGPRTKTETFTALMRKLCVAVAFGGLFDLFFIVIWQRLAINRLATVSLLPTISPLEMFDTITLKSSVGTTELLILLEQYKHKSVTLLYELGSIDLAAVLAYPTIHMLVVAKPSYMEYDEFREVLKVLKEQRIVSVLI